MRSAKAGSVKSLGAHSLSWYAGLVFEKTGKTRRHRFCFEIATCDVEIGFCSRGRQHPIPAARLKATGLDKS